MSALTLVIGSKAYSSWSLRPWLFLRHHRVAFQERLIALNADDTRRQILEHSPSGKVPVLIHGERRIWESLAICEYAAETFSLPGAWPEDADARAFARSLATEMHAGFTELRNELPFEAQRDTERKAYSPRAAADVMRVCRLWREARTRFGGDGEWLCGGFGIVDAMFAPVALRFFLYDVTLDGPERDYVDSVVLHPDVQAWMEAATLETPARAPAAAAKPTAQKTAAAPASPVEKPANAASASAPRAASKTATPAGTAKPSAATTASPTPPPAKPATPAQTAAPAAAQDTPAPTRLKSFLLPPD